MGTIFGSIGNLAGAQAGDWAQLTPDQKRQRRLDKFLNPPGLTFVSEKAKSNYTLRAQRLVDVYNVQEPDRVPINLPVGNLPYTNYGINLRTAMYDYDKAVAACKKFNAELAEKLEYWASPMMAIPGKILDLLDYKLYSWPGHKLGENRAILADQAVNLASRRTRLATRASSTPMGRSRSSDDSRPMERSTN